VTTDPDVCGQDTLLPAGLMAAAMALETEPERGYAVEERPVCYLQAGHGGAHYGVVLSLSGAESGSAWALWLQGGEPQLIVLPDCPAVTDNGMDACTHHAAHPGGHSWQLHDPLLSWAQHALANDPAVDPVLRAMAAKVVEDEQNGSNPSRAAIRSRIPRRAPRP
jgi:hypothetical protein